MSGFGYRGRRAKQSHVLHRPRILKVNHGGEHGASRIYAAQIAAAGWRCPDLVPELADLLVHERRHEQMFLALMPSRAARPCRLSFALA